MIDYLLIVKHLTHEDTINFANLEEESYYSGTDVYRYSLKGCTDIEVMFYASSNTLKVKGSFLYFQYGHNFVTERSRFIAAVRSVEDVLGIQLGDSFVEEFEYGAFLQVSGKPSDYIRNHKPLPCAKLEENQRPRDKGNFKWYDDQCVSLKMYDAKVNFNKKLTKEVKEELDDGCKKAKLLSIKEVCRKLKKGESTIYRWQKFGYLTPINVGGHTYYKEEEVMQYTSGCRLVG